MPDRSPARNQNARAYLLTILDTRPNGLGDDNRSYRGVHVDIFTERHPTLPAHAQAFQITMASGPSFAWCQNELLKLVDGDDSECTNPDCTGGSDRACTMKPAPYAWVKPLLVPRARDGHRTGTANSSSNVAPA